MGARPWLSKEGGEVEPDEIALPGQDVADVQTGAQNEWSKEKAQWKHHEWRNWAGRPGWMHPGAEFSG